MGLHGCIRPLENLPVLDLLRVVSLPSIFGRDTKQEKIASVVVSFASSMIGFCIIWYHVYEFGNWCWS